MLLSFSSLCAASVLVLGEPIKPTSRCGTYNLWMVASEELRYYRSLTVRVRPKTDGQMIGHGGDISLGAFCRNRLAGQSVECIGIELFPQAARPPRCPDLPSLLLTVGYHIISCRVGDVTRLGTEAGLQMKRPCGWWAGLV